MPLVRRGGEVLAGFDTPTLVGAAGRASLGRRDVVSSAVSEQMTRALGELARSCHTTVSTVLQGAYARVLMSLTGQRDVAFGTTVSGRPDEVLGSDSMVGLLINTVPVRARISTATTTADLLDQLQNDLCPDAGSSASGAQRDSSGDRSGSPVRHVLRLRELSDRCREVVGHRRVGRHELRAPRVQPLPHRDASHAGRRTDPARRVRHRHVRRGRRRGADRASQARPGGHDRRSGPSAVLVRRAR